MPAHVGTSKRDLQQFIASEVSSQKVTDVVESLDAIYVKGEQFIHKPKPEPYKPGPAKKKKPTAPKPAKKK